MIVVAMVAKRIQFDKPELLPWLRGLFFVSNIGVKGCCLAIHRKIRRNGDLFIAQHYQLLIGFKPMRLPLHMQNSGLNSGLTKYLSASN